MKPIIGILPLSTYLESDDSFKDVYKYGNNYVNIIIKNGGIPYFIPLCNNEVILNCLDNIDGLILPGGSKVLNANLDIVDYCYKKKIPMLGICLGMQTLAMYSVNKDLDEHKRIIKDVDNHWPLNIKRDNEDALVHTNKISKDSILYSILKKDKIEVNSLHKHCITEVGNDFRISMVSSDGIIEGIEYTKDDRFIIGVQFHPEVLTIYNAIFEVFIEKCKK